MASPIHAGTFAGEAGERSVSPGRFIVYMVLAGLVNAAIAACLLFGLPASRNPSLQSMFARALLFVAGAVLAGLAGARFYWVRSPAASRAESLLPFNCFALVSTEAWVWIPAIALLSRQDSPASAMFAAIGAALLAHGLRRALPQSTDFESGQLRIPGFEEHEIFADALRSAPFRWIGYANAFLLYLTGYLLFEHFSFTAGIPLALCAFLIVWELTSELPPSYLGDEGSTRSARRIASICATAVLVTFFVLLFGVAHRNRADAAHAALASGGDEVNGRKPNKPGKATAFGFESVILLPAPEKKQIVAPVPVVLSPFADRKAKPIVIHFDGAYWYFQPPDKQPGPNAHRTAGSPLAVDISANNFSPITMEAVQKLGTAVRVAPYHELQVSIANRDNLPGLIALNVVLTDTEKPGDPYVSLGAEPLVSSEPGQFRIKHAPTAEVLRFTFPQHTALRKFDEVAVFIVSDPAHFEAGPKIAIQEFAFVPR